MSSGSADIYKQIRHIQKAIKNSETPPKIKHVRAIILDTFNKRSSRLLYAYAARYVKPNQPVVHWKFLYMIYKLLRDGHRQCILDSITLFPRYMDANKSQYRGAPQNVYPIAEFINLLRIRLKIFRNYSLTTGNFQLSETEISKLTSSTPDDLFVVTNDLMKFLERLLIFEESVIKSVGEFRFSLYTAVGQCKMAPILPCLQDAAIVYDLTVRMLFHLHTKADHSSLTEHRQRFNTIHTALRTFFEQAGYMRYFHTLVEIPSLPQDPPNFCNQSEIERRTELRVKVTESDEPDTGSKESLENVGLDEGQQTSASSYQHDLVDLLALTQGDVDSTMNHSVESAFKGSNTADSFWATFGEETLSNPTTTTTTTNDNNNNNNALTNSEWTAENWFEVSESQKPEQSQPHIMEIELLKTDLERLQTEHDNSKQTLLDRIKDLEEQLQHAAHRRTEQEAAYKKLQDEMQARVTELETSNSSKFEQLKEAYRVLREKHVRLLREQVDVQRSLQETTQKNEQLERELEHAKSGLTRLSKVAISHSPQTNGESTSVQSVLLGLEQHHGQLEETIAQLRKENAELAQQVESRQTDLRSLHDEKLTLCESNSLLELQKSELNLALSSAEEKCKSMEERMAQLSEEISVNLRQNVLTIACAKAVGQIQDTFVRMDDEEALMEMRCSPEVLRVPADRAHELLSELQKLLLSNSNSSDVALRVQSFASSICETLFLSLVTPGTAANLTHSKDPLDLGKNSIHFLQTLPESLADSSSLATTLLSDLSAFCKSIHDLQKIRRCDEEMDDDKWESLLQAEMSQTSEAIRAAEAKFQKLADASQTPMSGQEIRIHQPILDRCSALMAAIGNLIAKCYEIQKSLKVERTKTRGYKRHSRWTQGLVSASKSVGACANFLVEVIDQVLDGQVNSLERLFVISQEVSASTTQVFVASRVKLDPESPLLDELQLASKQVATATGNLLASVKSAIDTQETGDLDFSSLTLTQAKRMEVECQVRALRLEAQLNQERMRLAQLRKEHYQNAADVESVSNTVTN